MGKDQGARCALADERVGAVEIERQEQRLDAVFADGFAALFRVCLSLQYGTLHVGVRRRRRRQPRRRGGGRLGLAPFLRRGGLRFARLVCV